MVVAHRKARRRRDLEVGGRDSTGMVWRIVGGVGEARDHAAGTAVDGAGIDSGVPLFATASFPGVERGSVIAVSRQLSAIRKSCEERLSGASSSRDPRPWWKGGA